MTPKSMENRVSHANRAQIVHKMRLVKNDGGLVPFVEPLPCGRGVFFERTGAVKCTLLLRG